MPHNNLQQHMPKGKLTLMALALSGALTAMAPVHAQSTSNTTQTWTSGNLDIDSSTIIDVTSGSGIDASGTLGTLSNSGVVRSTDVAGIANTGSITTLTNNSGGSISGGYYGIFNNGGTIDSLLNSGSISGTNYAGIINTGSITALTNTSDGTISGSTFGIKNTGNIGTLSNSGGIISGGSYGIHNTGNIDTLSNSGGTISGGGYGIYNTGNINTLSNSGGTISGGSYGIYNDSGSSISTLTNSGVISGTSGDGIYSAVSITSLTNNSGGTISGANYGIENVGGSIDTLLNSGVISGTNYAGIYNTGSITALTNDSGGTISSNRHGIDNDGGTIDTLLNSGVISANWAGIYNTGSITSLTNASGGTISGGSTGIYNGGTISTLLNSGVINVSWAGIYNYGSITSLTNASGGTISGGTAGIYNGGTISTLLNSGVINVSWAGIYNYGAITSLTNASGGTISASDTGIFNDYGGNISTLTNSGVINANWAGIYNYGAITSLTNNNGGTISGGSYGIYNDYGSSISTLTNSGLISGGVDALLLTSGSTLDSFTNTGTIAGNIENDGSTALTITGGSGTIFGTLTGYSGGIGASDIGSITNTLSNLTFAGNQLLNDNVNVGSSGTVVNTGTLQVNNPLTITGNYVQGSGSTLLIGVVSPIFNGDITDSGYGRLVVNGDATLDDSTVTIKSVSYALAQGQRYVVVAATGTLSTTGATYSASGYTVTGTTVADAGYTDLVLTLSGSTGSSAVNNATNGNAVSSLGGLFKYAGTDAALLAVYNPAAALDTAAANKAGAQLSPAAVTSAATQAAAAANQAVSNVATSHMDGFRVAQAGGSGVATGERASDIALWGQVFGGRAAQGERDNISGYHANYRGLLLGADTAVNDSLRAGGLFSAAKTSAAADGDNTGTSANINSYGLTAYATYTGAPWYVNVMAGAARQQYSTVRDISYTGFSGVANGSFNGQQYLTSVQAGYPLSLDTWLPGATLTPIAGLSYSTLRANGYTETGGSGAALTVNSATYNSLKSELGAKLESTVATSYGKLLPSVQLGWRHEFKDDAVQTGASFAADSTGSTAFISKSASAVANTAVLNLGVTLLQSQSLSLTGKYTLEAGGGYTAQTGSVQVRWQY